MLFALRRTYVLHSSTQKTKQREHNIITQERLFSKRSIQWWFILATESEENRAKASKFFQSSLISKLLHFAAIDFSSIHFIQIPLVAICTILYIEF